ncbi:MAG TPA: NTP transferase domain-containing protein, partial [Solirubrobacteraceae bacterium]|nr:NTP transferase domain-containing protein [Solirubrobacteraceae bacterium]
MGPTIAILPVKSLHAAKQRLTADLGGPQDGLARRMASGVLEALCAACSLDAVLVVTREPAIAARARTLGAEVVAEPELRGHNAAAALGVARAVELGARRVLLAAGDCPLLTADAVDAAIARHPDPGVVVFADRHGTGTNGLLLSPPDAIEAAFGPGSRERHERLARAAG